MHTNYRDGIAIEGDGPDLPSVDSPPGREAAGNVDALDVTIDLDGLARRRPPRFERYDPWAYDIVEVAKALMGEPPGRGRPGGLWWRCPIHDDVNPSLTVHPERNAWKCYGCGKSGGPAKLVMEVLRADFPGAKDWLRDRHGTAITPAAGKATSRPARRRSGVSREDAELAAEAGVKGLWRAELGGEWGRRYLHGRGLTDDTIKSAGIGYVAGRITFLPGRPGDVVTIPWHDAGRLAAVKLRRVDDAAWRYRWAYHDGPVCYPSTAAIRAGLPLIVCEGELDTLLMGQELAGLASVVTTGSSAVQPGPAVRAAATVASRIHVAHDADDGGDGAAREWDGATRVRPPDGRKDWTECYLSGIDLRGFWRDVLAEG